TYPITHVHHPEPRFSKAEDLTEKRSTRRFRFEGKRRFGNQWNAIDHRERVVLNEPPCRFLSNELGGNIASPAENRRTLLRPMRIGCNEVNTAMQKQNVGTGFCRNSELAGDAHCGDLNQNALRNQIRNNGRVLLDGDVAFRMNQNGMNSSLPKPAENFMCIS